jgi:PKD repeat protein
MGIRSPAHLLRSRIFLFASIIILLCSCGMVSAETIVCANPTCGGTQFISSDEWDTGDLGRNLPDVVCSGDFGARVCSSPGSDTFTYTVTIPPTVNLSRVASAHIDLDGFAFSGNCPGELYAEDMVFYDGQSVIRINGKQYTDCPFNQPSGKSGYISSWGFDIAPADLHSGSNTVSYEAYGWSSVVDDIHIRLDYVSVPPPELVDLTITPDIFVTGHDITVRPVVTGGSPDWEIKGISYYVLDTRSGAQEFFKALPDISDLTYRPGPGAYGEKTLIAILHVQDRMTRQQRTSEFYAPVTIYFDKGMYPNWIDDDANDKPNWLEYWAQDGAVPLLDNTVRYNASGTGFGVSHGGGDIELEPLAATVHYNKPIVIPDTQLSPAPAGESFGGPTVTGIDCAAEVMAHESYHDWVDAQWLPGGSFFGQDDTDYHVWPNITYNDELPDDYELFTSQTDSFDSVDTYNLTNIKNAEYESYGDQEYMAMRAGNGARGVADNDWAYPGKKVARQVIPGINPPIPIVCRGHCDVYAPRLSDGVFNGVVETPADTNANTDYDTLTAGNDIIIDRAGLYEISVVLRGNGGSGPEVIAVQQNQSEFAVGNYSVSAVFPGTDISSAGINGPYSVTLTWRHEYQENGNPPSLSWQTAPYLSTDFERAGAGFSGTVTAAPSSGDLLAEVPLTINKAGTYTLEGYLRDPSGVRMAYAANTTAFSAGTFRHLLRFDGNTITTYHLNGTYSMVSFRILDAAGATEGTLADAGNVTIRAEEFGTMEPIIIGVNADRVGDVNAEGRNGTLSVSIGINAVEAGDYFYRGSLFDAQNQLVQTVKGGNTVYNPGNTELTLNFSGKTIYNHGSNGTYTLRALEVFGPGGFDRRSVAYTTRAYNFTGFAQPVIVITGNVTDFPVDADSDGLYDAIRLGFDVDVGYTGCDIYGCGTYFPVTANLTGPGGALITIGGSDVWLGRSQTHHVMLDFPGTTLNGTGIDGPYAVEDLKAGDFYPSYYHLSYSTAAYNHTQFEPSAILAGIVRNESGAPVSGASVTALAQPGSTNTAGYYRFIYGESLSGGVTITPPADSGLSSGYSTVSVIPGTTIYRNFTLFSPARISGTVTAENGTLLTSGFVRASGPSTEIFTLSTWNNGSYLLSGLKNGTYDLSYVPPAGSDIIGSQVKGTKLLPGENRKWNVTAYNPRRLSGTVRNSGGNPLREATVSITEGPVIPGDCETDAAGAYSFPRLIPGNYTMVVTPPWADRDTLTTNTTNLIIALSDTTVTRNIVLMPGNVAPQAWYPDFYPADGNVPLTVSFTDQSRGNPTEWLWEFGDGATSTEQNPSHTYSAAGSYNITLTVTNAYGSDTGVFEDCIRVIDPRLVLPTGTLETNATGTFPLSADDFSGVSKVNLTLSWDPAVMRLNGVRNEAAFVSSFDTSIDNTTGTATIMLSFISMQEFMAVTRLADLNITAVGADGTETVLSAHPADQIVCAGGEGCYPGVREIPTNISVTNGSVRIGGGTGALPVVDFTANTTSGNAPLTVQFTDISDGSPFLWDWSFGDGNTSALRNPAFTYAIPGNYTVSLNVTNASGYHATVKPQFIHVTPTIGNYTLFLSSGWNFVSTPKKLATGNDTALIFRYVNTGGHSIWRYDARVKQWKVMNATTKIGVLDGIWVYSATATAVPLWFSQDPIGLPPEKQVYSGWNAIGFSDSTPLSANSTLMSVKNDWSSIIGYDAAVQGYEVSIINGGTGTHSDSREMLPVKGYWLFMVQNGTLAGVSA